MMCHIRISYQTSEELLVDLTKCGISCPSIGPLLKSVGECNIYHRSLERYVELMQKECSEVKIEEREKSSIEPPQVTEPVPV